MMYYYFLSYYNGLEAILWIDVNTLVYYCWHYRLSSDKNINKLDVPQNNK